jgi:UDP-glucose 4-epimerase
MIVGGTERKALFAEVAKSLNAYLYPPPIFLTGSDGFIGKSLAARCRSEGRTILATDVALHPDWNILNHQIADMIPEGSIIIHLAALSDNKACNANPEEAWRVNVEGTGNLARAAKKRNCKQFILASSEWVYEGLEGKLTEDRSLTESNQGVYARTKMWAEKTLLHTLPEQATILRFGIVYGPRKEAGSAVESIAKDASRGHTPLVGSARTARRFIHVEDIARGILASIGHVGAYNLTGDKLNTLQDVANATEPPFNALLPHAVIETDSDNPSIRDAPNDKARITFGWEPVYDLASGMKTLMEVEA